MRRLLIRVLLSIIIVLLALEGLLRLFDPLGLVGLANLEILNQHVQRSLSRGFLLLPGHYDLQGWVATETKDSTRAVPDNPGGACTLVFVGDSVTWSEGVGDAETWVNLVARQLRGVNVVNAAFYAYNSENVRGTIGDFPAANAIIYLVFNNDQEMTTNDFFATPPNYSYMMLYLIYLTQLSRGSGPPVDWPRFYRDLDAMRADPRVTFVAFDERYGRDLAARYPVHLIPYWTHNISRVDVHANVEGNRQIAAAMLPIAQSVVKDKCGG